MTTKAPDCACGYPEGINIVDCERCQLISTIDKLRQAHSYSLYCLQQTEEMVKDLTRSLQLRADGREKYLVNEESEKLADILNYCRVTGTRPTVECIESALRGQNSWACLAELPSC
jgi:hypothetical protein